MKILFIDSDQQYLLGLPAGFQKQGCQVKILCDIREEELDQVLEDYRPDLVVTVGWTKIHTRKKLQALGRLTKKYRVKHAYWSTEDPGWTDKWSLYYIETTQPDYIFTIDRASVSFYRGRGYQSHYLTWACNPEFHKPAAFKEAYRCDIAVVATGGAEWSECRKSSAQVLLKPLVEKNYDVLVWGKHWEDLDPGILGFSIGSNKPQGKLPYLETNHVYNSAKIVLGFQNSNRELTARTFEIMGAGGFLLAPATRAVLNTFSPGKHLAVSRSVGETIKMVDYYLRHDRERRTVARRGQSEVYSKYTYSHRAAEMLKVLD